MRAKSTLDTTGFRSWPSLREAAGGCTACPLFRNATQTVFGEGATEHPLVFVGEAPGDQEDRAGHPFVGPAGKLFDRALAEAGIDRKQAYVTNAVKHFKWTAWGTRRLHKKPAVGEMAACRPWLEAEIRIVRPRLLVCLGATAAHSAFGKAVRVGEVRGSFRASALHPHTFVTTHPSALLRAETPEQQREAYGLFVRELSLVAAEMEKGAAA